MKKLDFELETGDASIGELRPILEQAIRDHLGDGFLRHKWEGDVLRLSGPGARGAIVHQAGRLKLEAKLRAPASLAYRKIRRKVEAALDDVAAKVGQDPDA